MTRYKKVLVTLATAAALGAGSYYGVPPEVTRNVLGQVCTAVPILCAEPAPSR